MRRQLTLLQTSAFEGAGSLHIGAVSYCLALFFLPDRPCSTCTWLLVTGDVTKVTARVRPVFCTLFTKPSIIFIYVFIYFLTGVIHNGLLTDFGLISVIAAGL